MQCLLSCSLPIYSVSVSLSSALPVVLSAGLPCVTMSMLNTHPWTFFAMFKWHMSIQSKDIEFKGNSALCQASLELNILTGTGIPSTGPGGNPFFHIAWLAREEARPSTPASSSPIYNLVYFPDLKDALKYHMHAKHRLGYADRKTSYYRTDTYSIRSHYRNN